MNEVEQFTEKVMKLVNTNYTDKELKIEISYDRGKGDEN